MSATCFAAKSPCIFAHIHDLREHEAEYVKQIDHYISSKAVWSCVSCAVKARVIAALHICSKHVLLDKFLSHCEITDIGKALSILDRPRNIRQLRKKIARIERSMMKARARQGKAKVSLNDAAPKRLKKLKTDFLREALKRMEHAMTDGDGEHKTDGCGRYHDHPGIRELVVNSSVSGALARKIRKWAGRIKPDFLEHVMLELPKTAWKNVADLVHFRPSDFCVPYFLSDAYGDPIPEDSFVFRLRELIKAAPSEVDERFDAVASKFPQIYAAFAFLRLHPAIMSSRHIVLELTRNVPLETAMWHFAELCNVNRTCRMVLEERLSEVSDDHPILRTGKSFTYGKLLATVIGLRKSRESVLLQKRLEQIASVKLRQLQRYWAEERVAGRRIAVFGDASSSMQVAVEAATIFASMVSACLDGELSFFGTGLTASPHRKPKTVQDTLDVCSAVKARGCTNFAAALWPYMEQRKAMDAVVIVTDEWENSETAGYGFAELLRKYKEEVHESVALVVVRVGGGSTEFQRSLTEHGIDYSVVAVDAERPDLAKFDALLGQVATMCSKPGGAERHPTDDGVVVGDAVATSESAASDDFVVL